MSANDRLRVVHVLNELRPSGAEQMLRLAAPLFRAQGCELHILATAERPGPYAAPLEEAGYRVHHAPWSPGPRIYWHLARQWRRLGVGVVHVHAERGNLGYVLAARGAGASSVVRTVHNHFAFDGALRLRRSVERRIAERLGTHWVSIAPGVEANERERFGVDSTLIGNWYDSTRFVPPSAAQAASARGALGIDPTCTVLLVVGNCSAIKNHAMLLRALARCTVDGWLLLHAGQEEDGHPELALVEALGIAQRVRFLGAVPDMLPLLHASDLFVMPSLREGMSIALLEALGTGLPGLLARSPGLIDMQQWFGDLVYENPVEEDFAVALSRAIAGAREHDDAHARRRSDIARKHFGVERGVRAYMDLYRTNSARPQSLPPQGAR